MLFTSRQLEAPLQAMGRIDTPVDAVDAVDGALQPRGPTVQFSHIEQMRLVPKSQPKKGSYVFLIPRSSFTALHQPMARIPGSPSTSHFTLPIIQEIYRPQECWAESGKKPPSSPSSKNMSEEFVRAMNFTPPSCHQFHIPSPLARTFVSKRITARNAALYALKFKIKNLLAGFTDSIQYRRYTEPKILVDGADVRTQ
ncbi:hypothetical protein B0T17DRAFT_506795 [Bombardia bombarda]|uniref:Uncharacterized protein n=1 Tax=Bombardia bombarda TaxID=252184 RepID=A0AA39XAF7_9PEZI|nr:hypothetical protein B0T17DRAFT_506795 [Bombardia bombarda]